MICLFFVKMLLIFFIIFIISAQMTQSDPAADQLPEYKRTSSCGVSNLTTSAGTPVGKSEANNSLDDISLINNEFFIDTVTHFIAGRIHTRIVHAKGIGVHGYFEVTRNITNICKAKLFSLVGKRIEIAARFSSAQGEKGVSDTLRNARGLAVKFYTEEGNLDILTLSLPMFITKDPLLFMSILHSNNRNPSSNLFDANAIWDSTTLHPEKMFSDLYNFGDHGIAYSYRHMPGYSIHTYQVVNNKGVSHFVRFHFIPDLGIKNLFTEEAQKIANEDPDSFSRDLYNSIENGDFPTWTVSLQILTLEDVKNAAFDVFDVTRILPEELYPLTPVGRLVLNKNVLNNFAEVEQMAFCPSNLVPGVLGAPDKIFEIRRLAYRNAQYYRLGANFNKIPVNCPIGTTVSTYLRDGTASGSNGKDSPNFYPNSFCGPVAQDKKTEPKLLKIIERKPDNFDQATKLINDMSVQEQNRLVKNIVSSLESVNSILQDRSIELITKIHKNIGKRISKSIHAKRLG